MTGLQLYTIAVRIVIFAMFGSVSPQGTDDAPLTMQQVESLFKYEKEKPAFKDSTKNEVERLGVDFTLDAATEQRFRTLGMDQILRETIRRKARITTLTVQCEPVECEVTINNEVAGKTEATILTKSPVKPGSVTIKVTAPNYETQTTDAQIRPGEHVTAPKFTMVPQKGGLAITCGPAPVCGITVKGLNNGVSTKGETTQQRFTVQSLPLGEYEIEASAPPAFSSKTERFWVSAPEVQPVTIKLEEDPWGSKTDLQAFDAVVDSLGGKAILTDGASSKNTVRMRLPGDPPSIRMWEAQVVEYVSKNRLRWEMTIAATKWNVMYDGAKVSSNGDKKIYAGTEFAQELEQNIRLLSTMRLPSLLSLIRMKFDIKKGPKLVLIADSADERFTFQLNADYSPLKVLHEHLTAPRSQEEMEFAQYKSIGQDLKLPHVVILRYPDRPKHEHIFEYEKIDTSAPIKETLFKP